MTPPRKRAAAASLPPRLLGVHLPGRLLLQRNSVKHANECCLPPPFISVKGMAATLPNAKNATTNAPVDGTKNTRNKHGKTGGNTAKNTPKLAVPPRKNTAKGIVGNYVNFRKSIGNPIVNKCANINENTGKHMPSRYANIGGNTGRATAKIFQNECISGGTRPGDVYYGRSTMPFVRPENKSKRPSPPSNGRRPSRRKRDVAIGAMIDSSRRAPRK